MTWWLWLITVAVLWLTAGTLIGYSCCVASGRAGRGLDAARAGTDSSDETGAGT